MFANCIRSTTLANMSQNHTLATCKVLCCQSLNGIPEASNLKNKHVLVVDLVIEPRPNLPVEALGPAEASTAAVPIVGDVPIRADTINGHLEVGRHADKLA